MWLSCNTDFNVNKSSIKLFLILISPIKNSVCRIKNTTIESFGGLVHFSSYLDLTKLLTSLPQGFCTAWANVESSQISDLRLLLWNLYGVGRLSNLWLSLWFSKERLLLVLSKISESFLSVLYFALTMMKLISGVSLFCNNWTLFIFFSLLLEDV